MRGDSALDLRRDFDRSFAEAQRVDTAERRHLLAVSIAGDPHALGVDEIGALVADRRIVPVPSPLPELVGMAAFRGQIAPVYDLGAMLGYPPRRRQRWLVLARHLQPVAFAFDAFEEQLSVTLDRIVPFSDDAPERSAARTRVDHAVRGDDGALRPVVRLASIIDALQRRIDAARYAKEP